MNVFMKIVKTGITYAIPMGLAAFAMISEKIIDDKVAESRDAKSEPEENDETTKVDEKDVKVEDENGKEAK